MRVLVTGGAGFIGSALARRLIGEGHEVVVADNLSTSKPGNVPQRAVFVQLDLSEPEALSQLPDGPYDAVAHLAAQSSGAIGQADPYADMRVNIGATLLMSRWAIDKGIRRFLYTSSMTVYGQGNREPLDEGAPCVPVSYYGAAKLASENYLRLAAAAGASVTCFRLYNVYGRGQNLGNLYQGMASIYLAYLLKQVPVPVTGSFDRFRDFVHVDDVVDAMVRVLSRPATPSLIYNIGTGKKTTVCELLRMLIAVMKLPENHPVEEGAGSPSDVFGSVANAARALKELGWSPHVELRAGLEDMAAWARTQQ